MNLLITPQGNTRCIYSEDLDLAALGEVQIHRASALEPDEIGQWWADLSPVGGPRLGPFRLRSDGLEAERRWLELNWLCGG